MIAIGTGHLNTSDVCSKKEQEVNRLEMFKVFCFDNKETMEDCNKRHRTPEAIRIKEMSGQNSTPKTWGMHKQARNGVG